MAKTTKTKIDQLIPDNMNANKGTMFGRTLIEKSLKDLGAGRSVLLDKNNRIIAGNKTIENAAAIGLENVIIVETTGDQIVAVKRTDIDLDSEKGRALAIADNATSKANLEWDKDVIAGIKEEWNVNPDDWGIDMPADPNEDTPEEKSFTPTFKFEVECKTESERNKLMSELLGRGFKCTDDY